MSSASTTATVARTASVQRSLTREVTLVGLCCLAYSILCNIAPVTAGAALRNARQILGLEEFFGLDVELRLNLWLQNHRVIADVSAVFYSLSFFVFTFGALMIIWFARPSRYRYARNALFLMTAGAMVTYWVYPLAPPRLLKGTAFIDSVATGSALGSGYSKLSHELANPYAAMPSMHTGWSVWVAVSLGAFVWRKSWQRMLLALHPIATVVTILATGNHYVLDAVAGIAYCLGAFAVVSLFISRPGNEDPVESPTLQRQDTPQAVPSLP